MIEGKRPSAVGGWRPEAVIEDKKVRGRRIEGKKIRI
jgi:hypothetical protein